MYPKECKSRDNKDTCTFMFIIALFSIAMLLKQFKCLTTDKWITHTIEYYSALKKNEILFFTGK
jgi:hypothetical protein